MSKPDYIGGEILPRPIGRSTDYDGEYAAHIGVTNFIDLLDL